MINLPKAHVVAAAFSVVLVADIVTDGARLVACTYASGPHTALVCANQGGMVATLSHKVMTFVSLMNQRPPAPVPAPAPVAPNTVPQSQSDTMRIPL